MTSAVRRSPRPVALLLAGVLSLTVGLAACTDDGSGSADDGGDAAPSAGASTGGFVATADQALADGRTVIDVRTPEEYEEGHVADATLIDIEGESFDADIAALDPGVSYVVYCRTGNRAGRAVDAMADVGLDVVNGGGLEDMLEAGWSEG